MKIAFIYRGDPRHRTANRISMLQNIAAAKRLGHEVVLVIPREGMTGKRAQQEVDRALAEFGISESVPVKTIPRPAVKTRFRRSFDFLAALWVRRQRFELVWSREFHAADFTTALGVETVLEHHHPFTARQWRVARRMLQRDAFKGVAAISGVHRQMLMNEGWPAAKVVVAHSGVDLERFSRNGKSKELRRRFAGPQQPLFAYAGSLYEGKGVSQLIEAARQIPKAKFLFIGGAAGEVAKFQERARADSVANVEFLGHVRHADLPSYLHAADVLVAPFTSDSRDVAGKVIIPFASPLKLFEYMAAGKPIITSKVGAIPEVISDDENGLLVAPGDVNELIAAVSRLIDEPATVNRLGEAARKQAAAYSWDSRVKHILRFVAGVEECRNS